MRKHIQSKKASIQDWHRADIKAALEKAGWSLSRLSTHHGFCTGALKHALYKPYVNGERLIAAAIGVTPQTIWPSRYLKPRPLFGKGGRPTHKALRNKGKDTSSADSGNVKDQVGE